MKKILIYQILIGFFCSQNIFAKSAATINAEPDPRCDVEFLSQMASQRSCLQEGKFCEAQQSDSSGGATVGAVLAAGTALTAANKNQLEAFKKIYRERLQHLLLSRRVSDLTLRARATAIRELLDEKGFKDNDLRKSLDGYLREESFPFKGRDAAIIVESREAGAFDLLNKKSPKGSAITPEQFDKAIGPKVKAEIEKITEGLNGPARDVLSTVKGLTDSDPESILKSIDAKLDSMAPKLLLTDDEQARIKQIHQAVRMKISQENSDLSADAARRTMSDFYERADKKVIEILERDYPEMAWKYQFDKVEYHRTLANNANLDPRVARDFSERVQRAKNVYDQSNTHPTKAGVAGKVVAAGMLGTVFTEASKAAAESRLNQCKGDLRLSDTEKAVLQSIVVRPAVTTSCREIRLVNPQTAIEDLYARFGFIPKGSCDLLQREFNSDKDLASLGGKSKISVTCQEISIGDKPNGPETKLPGMTCKPEQTAIFFNTEADEDGNFEFSEGKTKAYTTAPGTEKVRDATPYLYSFLTKYNASTKIDPDGLVSAGNLRPLRQDETYLRHSRSFYNGSSIDSTSNCYRSAVLVRAAKKLQSRLGLCPRPATPAEAGGPDRRQDTGAVR